MSTQSYTQNQTQPWRDASFATAGLNWMKECIFGVFTFATPMAVSLLWLHIMPRKCTVYLQANAFNYSTDSEPIPTESTSHKQALGNTNGKALVCVCVCLCGPGEMRCFWTLIQLGRTKVLKITNEIDHLFMAARFSVPIGMRIV